MIASRIAELRTLAAFGQQGQKSQAIRELCDEVQRLQKRRENKGFSIHDVMVMAEQRKWKPGAAEAFFDHYEMVGWVYGKCRHPIKKLAGAMATWERTAKNGSAPLTTENTGSKYGVG